jgi:DNA repair exonuclease SbcCD ATPase subunit
MDSVKTFKVKLEIKEVTGCGKIQPIFELRLNELKQTIPLKGSILIENPEVLNSTLHITAFNGERPLGSTKTSLTSILNDKSQLKPEKWLKVKTEEFQNFRVKVMASHSGGDLPVKEKETPKVSRPSTSKSERVVECPYLSKLASNNTVSIEPLDEIWRNRNEGNSLIKLSFEPDQAKDLQGSQEVFNEVDLKNFECIRSLNSVQLKQAVKGLCEEVRQLEVISKALPELRDTFNSKSSERKRIGNEGLEMVSQMKIKWQEQSEDINKLLKIRSEAKQKLQERQETAKDLEKQRDQLKSELLDLQKSRNFNGIQSIYQKLIDSSEHQKSELHQKILFEQEEMKKALNKTNQEISSFKKDAEDLSAHVKRVSQEYNSAKDLNIQLKKQINELQSLLENPSAVESRHENKLKDLKQVLENKDHLNKELKTSALGLESNSKELKSQFFVLKSQKETTSEVLKEEKSQVESVESSISKLQNEFLTSILAKVSNEQICCLRADLSSLISDISHLLDVYSTTRPSLLPDLDKGGELISSESEKILLQAERLDQMIESIDHKEEELDQLKTTMGQVKKRHIVHTPVKTDPLDMSLADLVNSKEVPVKFTRLDGGNYLFGSTKVYLKLENSKLLAKIKGGFISIEDFLTTYTPIEVSKADSRGKSPVQRKSSAGPGLNSSFLKSS